MFTASESLFTPPPAPSYLTPDQSEGFAMLRDGQRHWIVCGCNVLCGNGPWNFELVLDIDRENPRNCPHCTQLLEANKKARGVMSV